ncbi:MAG: hypothetical protein HYU73_01760 [Betaproteobacteria bacterium]|nr:hypothetical protein [Betaproteobacteria bacterium]
MPQVNRRIPHFLTAHVDGSLHGAVLLLMAAGQLAGLQPRQKVEFQLTYDGNDYLITEIK